MVIAGITAVFGAASGTAMSRYQGLSERPLPFFSMPIDVPPILIVSPPLPVAVVHGSRVAGGAQKPTGSMTCPRAQMDRAKKRTAVKPADRVIRFFPPVTESGTFHANHKCRGCFTFRFRPGSMFGATSQNL